MNRRKLFKTNGSSYNSSVWSSPYNIPKANMSIHIYTIENCKNCDSLKAKLSALRVPFEVSVHTKDELRALYPDARSAPVMTINGIVRVPNDGTLSTYLKDTK